MTTTTTTAVFRYFLLLTILTVTLTAATSQGELLLPLVGPRTSVTCTAENMNPCQSFPGLCSVGRGLCTMQGPCEYACMCPPDGRIGRDCRSNLGQGGGRSSGARQDENGGKKVGSLINSLLVFPHDLFWELNRVAKPGEVIRTTTPSASVSGSATSSGSISTSGSGLLQVPVTVATVESERGEAGGDTLPTTEATVSTIALGSSSSAESAAGTSLGSTQAPVTTSTDAMRPASGAVHPPTMSHQPATASEEKHITKAARTSRSYSDIAGPRSITTTISTTSTTTIDAAPVQTTARAATTTTKAAATTRPTTTTAETTTMSGEAPSSTTTTMKNKIQTATMPTSHTTTTAELKSTVPAQVVALSTSGGIASTPETSGQDSSPELITSNPDVQQRASMFLEALATPQTPLLSTPSQAGHRAHSLLSVLASGMNSDSTLRNDPTAAQSNPRDSDGKTSPVLNIRRIAENVKGSLLGLASPPADSDSSTAVETSSTGHSGRQRETTSQPSVSGNSQGVSGEDTAKQIGTDPLKMAHLQGAKALPSTLSSVESATSLETRPALVTSATTSVSRKQTTAQGPPTKPTVLSTSSTSVDPFGANNDFPNFFQGDLQKSQGAADTSDHAPLSLLVHRVFHPIESFPMFIRRDQSTS